MNDAQEQWREVSRQMDREAEYTATLEDLVINARSLVGDALDEAEADEDLDAETQATIISLLEEVFDDLAVVLAEIRNVE